MSEDTITIEVKTSEAMGIANMLKNQVEGDYSTNLSWKVAEQIDGFRE